MTVKFVFRCLCATILLAIGSHTLWAKEPVKIYIITDLEGDSLMLLSLLEIFRKKHKLTLELKALGKHLMKKPANTIGQVIELTKNIVKHGDALLSVQI